MQRKNVDPVVIENKDDVLGKTRETHNAFGIATVSRGHGSGRSLFQSDILHRESITLRIKRADRTRNHDWTFGTEELIEVEMSLAQWGALISSQGISSGTPVTIRWVGSEMMDDIPFQPRIQENLAEVKGSFQKTFAQVQKAFERVESAFDEKKGMKEQREAIRSLKHVIANIPTNATFAVKSLKEAAEHVVSQATADIEAHILRSQQVTGYQASIEAPEITLEPLEIEAPDRA